MPLSPVDAAFVGVWWDLNEQFFSHEMRDEKNRA